MKKAIKIDLNREWLIGLWLSLAVLSLVYAAASVLRYRLTSLHELSLTPAHLAKGDPNEEEFKIFLAADRERVDKLKKDNPRDFWTPKVQNEMHQSAMKLGENFYN